MVSRTPAVLEVRGDPRVPHTKLGGVATGFRKVPEEATLSSGCVSSVAPRRNWKKQPLLTGLPNLMRSSFFSS